MSLLRPLGLGVVLTLGILAPLLAQTGGTPAKNVRPKDDLPLVRSLIECRSKYQETLEQLRLYYISAGDLEKARWAEDELRQYHRMSKQSYRLDLDVPPPTLEAKKNIPEANELYKLAMAYKDKGWGNDYIDNQRRAEILLQQLLTNYPESDKIGDTAYQLGDVYESRAYKQYRRAAYYYERSFQWNPTTQLDARMKAARIYDHQLVDRTRARELYMEVKTHDTDPKRLQEAEKRIKDLGGVR
jgi:TolA-binding protein